MYAMVWPYVVIGLIVIIAILILMRSDSGPLKRRSKHAQLITDVTYVCMHCGHTFKGSSCPKCGADRKPIEFGK